MAVKYHINQAGNPGKCDATIKCPYGGVEDHYPSAEDARKAFEVGYDDGSSAFTTFKRSDYQKATDIIPAMATAVQSKTTLRDQLTVGEALDDIAFRRLAKS